MQHLFTHTNRQQHPQANTHAHTHGHTQTRELKSFLCELLHCFRVVVVVGDVTARECGHEWPVCVCEYVCGCVCLNKRAIFLKITHDYT